jgi:hypothetical protein
MGYIFERAGGYDGKTEFFKKELRELRS